MHLSRIILAIASGVAGCAVSPAQEPDGQSPPPTALAAGFDEHVQPLLKRLCVSCHNVDQLSSGVRVDQLSDATEAQDERHLKLWQSIVHQLRSGKMPPNEEPQPTAQQRASTVAWIESLIQQARSRPQPQNGSTRRLTVAQYRNTLVELLGLDADLTKILPPDAVSRDGFLNNQETLQLSPLLLEAYFQIAAQALDRVLVDPSQPPEVQVFRVDLGTQVNPQPCPDELILGANSHLLPNADFIVRQLPPSHPAFKPLSMDTKYRFIEGYAGNDTVRQWRQYDSIYHAVFACMRGSEGYPKGHAYDIVPSGLLLRPAIPSIEEFEIDSTYGPKANFKISLRQLPEQGRFRVTVAAAKYDDGLLLESSDARPVEAVPAVVCNHPEVDQTIDLPESGIYRIDVFPHSQLQRDRLLDESRLDQQLLGYWPLDGTPNAANNATLSGQLQGNAGWHQSPFGQALHLSGRDDAVRVPRSRQLNVGADAFSVTAWINPEHVKAAGLIGAGKPNWTHGWYLDLMDNQGRLRLETANARSESNGSLISPPGVIVARQWQHIAAIINRSEGSARLFVNGVAVAKGTIHPADLDNMQLDLLLGRVAGHQPFQGQIDEVRLYGRALDESEIHALIEPRRALAQPPKLPPPDLQLWIDQRQFAAKLEQPAFVALRLNRGTQRLQLGYSGAERIERVELTRLTSGPLMQRFETFEKRQPKLGVHLGLRRDCGSTLTRVGAIQAVSDTQPAEFVFEGAIEDFPSPDVEKDNVNYLAGLREIGVRSEYTDARDMPRLLIKSVQFEGPLIQQWPPVSHTQIMQTRAADETEHAYARRVLSRFAQRAWRRPIQATELDLLMRVFDQARRQGQSLHQAIRDGLQVTLTSPQFLFLIEKSQTPAPEPLEPFELASKLSYFLWNGPPDQVLLDLAASGQLSDQLDAQVDRMWQDQRRERFIESWVTQWLALDKFQVLEPDRESFPKLTRLARNELAQEPVRLIEYLIQNNRPLSELIASEIVMANEVVASYYGLGEQVESGFGFVPVKHHRPDLGGLLSQASLLAGLSDGRYSNPIKRGAWLARKIIDQPPDDPPPNVPELKLETEHLPLRERLEMHRNQSGCVQCHAKIDPYGIALEEYDAGGRRKLEAADAQTQLPDGKLLAGANDLKRYLAEERIDQVAFSFMRHLAVYACGRDLSYYELESLRQTCQKLRVDDYPMRDMLRCIVHTPMFLEK